jgi:type I restriction-modification system DNA methylase subunit
LSSSFDSAYQTIAELVNDFKTNEQHYLNPTYSEADVRNDFINKFFIALGWDVRHDIQKNPYEQEVRVEKPVLIAKAQKRADYSFSIAPNFRTVKFFVEAKKPAHALENKDYYFQTARYGWNASTPVAVLTDFEEFHIIDCRFRPNINDALNYKLEKFLYTDYTDKEKFAKIYYLFSREAVVDNSIEKYAESLPKPRGKKAKGLKAVAQTIDESFLEELDEIRNNLAKSFKKNNTHLSSEELTEATQRTIDRLVFIKFLEDKLIEPEHYVSQFSNPPSLPPFNKGRGGAGSAWEKFIRASRTLDAKYNGVVFKKSLIDTRNIIEPDDKTFSAICEELSHENTPYNFDAIPIHILGSIYERFLGKVVNATDKRVTIEEKPEVRKAGGVYYTPQYIVNYIVDNTIGNLIEGKTPKEIAKMRFADIACGSGSFLITVFERLLDYHKRWYVNNPEQAKKDGCILIEGSYHLSLKQKTKILLNNIYGVDIDQQAVEVTQLSLYLKLLEDETTATANDSWVMFKEQLLPDLNKNIVCGNSLIGTDILNPSFALPFGKGEGWVGFDELKLKPMDFETVFPEVMNPSTGSGGGFDAIVGNPPWIDIKGINPVEVKYYFENFNSTSNRMNIYATFFEKALKLLSKVGCLGYIVPNSILYQSSYKELRRIILDELYVKNIIRLPDNVFKNVKAESVVLIISQSETKFIECLIYDRKGSIDIIENKSVKEIKKLNQNKWKSHELLTFDIFSNEDIINLIAKIEKDKIPLEEICDFSLGITPYDKYRGHSKKLIEDREFHSTVKKNKSFKELLAGGDVERYFVEWGGKEYLSYGDWLGAPREIRFFTLPRILVRQIVSGNPLRIYAGYTQEELYNTQTIFNILVKHNSNFNTKIILAIMNSSLINFYHAYKYLDLSKNLFQKILIQNCKKFPIPKVELNNEGAVVSIIEVVDQILAAKKQLQQATTEGDKNYLNRKCEILDKQIDELVYNLYGLTEEEIKIVEGK